MTNKYENVFINDYYTLLCSNKNSPIIMKYVDKFINDYYCGEKTIELAEAKYQEYSIKGLLNKCKLIENDIDLLISSDLQNQLLSSSLSSSKFKISHLGIYSACTSFAEGLIIASNFVNNENKKIIVTTSSHNLVSEKQFRFPVEYGAIRKMVNTCTASGSVSAMISRIPSKIKIDSSTIGSVIQTNHKDANDLGSAMAPSCAEVLYKHLHALNRKPTYYDVILTGDLGEYGVEIMKLYYKKKYSVSLNNIIDAGSIFYKDNKIYAGSSGPACATMILFNHILMNKKYKKILFIATGSLHSIISCNLNIPIPSVSHAISLEVI